MDNPAWGGIVGGGKKTRPLTGLGSCYNKDLTDHFSSNLTGEDLTDENPQRNLTDEYPQKNLTGDYLQRNLTDDILAS